MHAPVAKRDKAADFYSAELRVRVLPGAPFLIFIGRSSSGRTADFDSAGSGSIPLRPANSRLRSKAVLHSFHTGGITGSNPVGATTFGSVAQSAERLAHNQLVTGSCPVGPTIFNRRSAQPFDFSSCWGGGIWHTRMSQTHVPEGSSPSPGTSSIRRWWNWSTRQLERLVGCKALAGSNPALRTIAADFA